MDFDQELADKFDAINRSTPVEENIDIVSDLNEITGYESNNGHADYTVSRKSGLPFNIDATELRNVLWEYILAQ
eukprot:6877939-Ditylum_brightwellii.AAC.1